MKRSTADRSTRMRERAQQSWPALPNVAIGAAAVSPNVWVAAACVVVSGFGNGVAIQRFGKTEETHFPNGKALNQTIQGINRDAGYALPSGNVWDGAGIDLSCDIAEGLPLETGSMDYVVSIHALPEVPYDRIVPVLAELRRVMVAIFTELGPDDEIAAAHRRRLAAALS